MNISLWFHPLRLHRKTNVGVLFDIFVSYDVILPAVKNRGLTPKWVRLIRAQLHRSVVLNLVHVHASVSVTNCVHVHASVSSTNYVHVHASVSCTNWVHVHASVSCTNWVHVHASFSCTNWFHVHASVSCTNWAHVHSSVSCTMTASINSVPSFLLEVGKHIIYKLLHLTRRDRVRNKEVRMSRSESIEIVWACAKNGWLSYGKKGVLLDWWCEGGLGQQSNDCGGCASMRERSERV